MLSIKIHFKYKNSLKDMEKYTTQMLAKKSGVASFRQRRFEDRNITKDRKRHRIMIKRAIFKESVQVLNLFALDNRVSKHMRQTLIAVKEERDNP